MRFRGLSATIWLKRPKPCRSMAGSAEMGDFWITGLLVGRQYHGRGLSGAGVIKDQAHDTYVLSSAKLREMRVCYLKRPWLSSPAFDFSSTVDINNQKDFDKSLSGLVLYSYWQSSCSWRVRFALQLKGLSYEYKPVDLIKGEQFRPEFQVLNPLGYVPVLVDGDVAVSDSFAILLHLEENYPRRALLPADPQLRALNLQVASIISSSVQPLHMLSMLKSIEKKVGPEETKMWAQGNIEKGFQALEKLLKGFAGKLTTGDEVHMADVFLGPQIAVATERFDIDLSIFPTLRRLYRSYMDLPEFIASSPRQQPDAVL